MTFILRPFSFSVSSASWFFTISLARLRTSCAAALSASRCAGVSFCQTFSLMTMSCAFMM